LLGIRRLKDKHSSVGVVYSESNDVEEIAYCQRCLEIANARSKLRNRIYLPDSSREIIIPPDADKWRQCWTCGKVYPKYEVKQEGKLDDFTEATDNPFDFGDGHARSVEVRKFDRSGRTQRKRKPKQDLEQYKEDDIKDALRKGSKLVS
jgi:hypothetical protein